MAERWMQAAHERMEAKGTVGSFSRAAKRAGEGTQAYARKVLASPKASGAMKKKANFARNAAKAHHGG